MTAPFKSWTVLPHKRIEQVTENILTTVGEIHMPIGEFPRRMTVVRLASGQLVIFSAISLDEPEMAALEAFGTPSFMIVPSERHRLDAPAWKQRYPDIWVIAPSGAREEVEKVVTVDDSQADFGDDAVRYVEVPGTDGHEAALEVEGEDGLTLIVNEIIGDVHSVHGLRGWLLERMGFAGEEPQVPAPVKMQFARGREALAAQFRRWADRPQLRRIIVSHGDIITEDPAGVLRKLAQNLD